MCVDVSPKRGLRSRLSSRRWAAPVILVVIGVALAGCSTDAGEDTAPPLPSILTTTTVEAEPRLQFYEVQPGDTLTSIAEAFSIPVEALMQANPDIASPDDIHAGDSIKIPADDDATGVVQTSADQTVPAASKASTGS